MALTLETAGALVSGSKSTEVVMDNAKTIRVIRAFYHNRVVMKVGEIFTVPEGQAKMYVNSNKAEFVAETPKVEPKKVEAPAPEKKETVIASGKSEPINHRKGGK